MTKRAFVRAGRFVESSWTKRAIEIAEGEFDEVLASADEVSHRIERAAGRLLEVGWIEGESRRIF